MYDLNTLATINEQAAQRRGNTYPMSATFSHKLGDTLFFKAKDGALVAVREGRIVYITQYFRNGPRVNSEPYMIARYTVSAGVVDRMTNKARKGNTVRLMVALVMITILAAVILYAV